MDESDLISSLPDPVLCDILSFLPTKLAVATSVLSKRWRFLWTWVPSLDFDFDTDTDTCFSTALTTVCTVLSLPRQCCIQRLALKWHSVFDPFHLDSWLHSAISRKVQELDLLFYNVLPCSVFSCKTLVILKLCGVAIGEVPCAHLPSLKALNLSWIDYKDGASVHTFFSACPVLEELVFRGVQRFGNTLFRLPRCVFHIETLAALKIYSEMVVNVPSRFHLPRLKILHLQFVEYKDDNSVRNIFSGCPALQELYVDRLDWDNVIDFEIASPTLRKLVIQYRITGDSLEEFHSRSHKLRVNAPALKYLENLGNLDQANLIVSPCYKNPGSVELSVLQPVCNVKFLRLQLKLMKALCNVDIFDKFPEFHNVLKLDLCEFWCPWGVVGRILDKFPRLRCLLIDKASVDEEGEGSWTTQPPASVPNCLTFHLVGCFFRRFKGSEDEMEYVRYVVQNALVLRKMKIYFAKLEPNTSIALEEKIAMFQRGSHNCQLVFAEEL